MSLSRGLKGFWPRHLTNEKNNRRVKLKPNKVLHLSGSLAARLLTPERSDGGQVPEQVTSKPKIEKKTVSKPRPDEVIPMHDEDFKDF